MLPRLKLRTRFTLILVLFFLISIGLTGVALFRHLTTIAEESVASNGLLLLHTMNAVRSYTADQIDPLVNPLMDVQKRFILESVPAYSARTVFERLRGDTPYQQFYYKEASFNPTAPQDRADEWESGVLERFIKDRSITEINGFRIRDGQAVFYNARPMVVTKAACLGCHTTPETAPPWLVEHYGPINGFGWKLNDVIAAQVVYVPAAEVYNRSRQTWLSVMLIAVTIFALAVLAIDLALRRAVIRPVTRMAELARRISSDELDEKAPETLAEVSRRSDELGQMAQVFQRMAQEVYAREQALKQQVHALKIEIDEVRKAREVDEVVNTSTFQSLRAKAEQMRQRRRGAEEGPATSAGDTPQDAGEES